MNAVVDTSRLVEDNLVDMLASMRADLVWQNGKYRLVVGQVTTAETVELLEADIVGPIKWVRKGASIPNSVQATFADSLDGNYTANTVAWPLVGDTTFLDEDAGIENMAEVSLPYTTTYHQALRTIMVLLREARNDVLATFTAKEKAYAYQVGNVILVTHAGPGWSQLAMTVKKISLTPDGLVALRFSNTRPGRTVWIRWWLNRLRLPPTFLIQRP